MQIGANLPLWVLVQPESDCRSSSLCEFVGEWNWSYDILRMPTRIQYFLHYILELEIHETRHNRLDDNGKRKIEIKDCNEQKLNAKEKHSIWLSMFDLFWMSTKVIGILCLSQDSLGANKTDNTSTDMQMFVGFVEISCAWPKINKTPTYIDCSLSCGTTRTTTLTLRPKA